MAERQHHYSDVIMGTMVSQITSLVIVHSTVYSGADQRKHQSSASLAFVRGIHRWPVNSTHKGPVTRKMFPFDDVIMIFKLIFFNANLVSNYTINNNKPELDQATSQYLNQLWSSLLTHICVAQSRLVNTLRSRDASVNKASISSNRDLNQCSHTINGTDSTFMKCPLCLHVNQYSSKICWYHTCQLVGIQPRAEALNI